MKRPELQRKTPLKRSSPLSAIPSPEDYTDQDGKPIVRPAPKLKQTVLKPVKRKVRKPIPQGERRRAAARTLGRCIRCGNRARQLHHVLPVRMHAAFQTTHLNLVPVCTGCHDEHERAHRRFTQREIPAEVWAWCVAQDRGYMQRTYPV